MAARSPKTCQVLLSGLTQLTKVPSDYKKPLGKHSTFRKSRFAFWFSWPRTNNMFVTWMSQLSSYMGERPWIWNAPPSPTQLCELVPPFPTDLCWSLFLGKKGLVVLARLGTKFQIPCKQEIFCKDWWCSPSLLSGHAAGNEWDCVHMRLLRSVPSLSIEHGT